jgi:redox-sensitive bicupin YhaK (pirin superfamily)
MHADSLGYHQPIQSGAVNLMTAGRGIVHSERAGSDLDVVSRLHGIQSWMALPDEHEELAPAFAHTPAADIPEIEQDGAVIRVIMGEAYGKTSPVTTYSTTLYLHCQLTRGAELALPSDYDELAFYVASGQVRSGDVDVSGGVMMVACPDSVVSLRATEDSCVMVVGGSPVGERHIYWNFVSSSRERIEEAKQEWRAGGFDRIDGDDEFIPLPA